AEPTVFRMDRLAVTGNDIVRILGIPPGPDVGKIKRLLFEKILDDPRLNTYQELKKQCRSLPIKK
ncbi:MAG: CCA tRNA nucleotidyltransferase, partial [Desulfobacula sp.]|nr:CCA tRNA nucleotidyltransferase [Desulfobacula sp.]